MKLGRRDALQSPTTRTNNSRNQVTAVGGSALTFDSPSALLRAGNGNTTTDEKGKTYSFDAWNRMTTAKAAGPTLLTTYGWDADGRRITQNPNTTTDLYFSTAVSSTGEAYNQRTDYNFNRLPNQ